MKLFMICLMFMLVLIQGCAEQSQHQKKQVIPFGQPCMAPCKTITSDQIDNILKNIPEAV